jgi:hypothetical protein
MAHPAPLVNETSAPEIFCDGAAGALWHNGTMRVTLESLRANHNVQPAALQRVVVGYAGIAHLRPPNRWRA